MHRWGITIGNSFYIRQGEMDKRFLLPNIIPQRLELPTPRAGSKETRRLNTFRNQPRHDLTAFRLQFGAPGFQQTGDKTEKFTMVTRNHTHTAWSA